MNEEKYAYIKLISGEEIFAQVEEFVDEDKCLVAFDPCFIKELPVKRGPFSLYRVEPWLKLSDERMFAFDLKNVLYYGYAITILYNLRWQNENDPNTM